MAKHETTQAQLAALLGITQQRVSQFIQKGVLTRGAPLTQWVRELYHHQARIIAQHESRTGLDLIEERARLSARMAEKLEIEIAAKKGELLPVPSVVQTLNHRNSALRSKLLALPSRYKSMFATLTPKQVDGLDNLVREVLTELANEQLSADIAGAIEQYFSNLRASAQIDHQPVGGPPQVSEPGI
jgi:phage terminase Nu1 subunit (DNA packaging protein)